MRMAHATKLTGWLLAGLLGGLTSGSHAGEAEPREFFSGQPKGLGEQTVAGKFNYAGEVFRNFSGGQRIGTIYEGLVDAGVGINLERLAGWKDTVFFANVICPHGDGLTNRYTGDLNVLSSIDANDGLRLENCWLQTSFADGKWSVRAGQIVVDAEFAVVDGAAAFLNSGFGLSPTVADNINLSTYPVAAPGLRVAWKPDKIWTLQAAVSSGDAGTLVTNPRNARWNLSAHDGVAVFAEAIYQPYRVGGGLPGTMKLGGFYDSKFFPAQSGSGSWHGDYGFYAILDQMVWPKGGKLEAVPQGVDVFAKAAFAPEHRNFIEYDFEAGMTYTGPFPGRTSDVAGIGLVQAKVSDDARGPDGRRFSSHRETVLEFFYQAAINDHFSVQPDFQYIVNPGATNGERDAVVGGLRFNLLY